MQMLLILVTSFAITYPLGFNTTPSFNPFTRRIFTSGLQIFNVTSLHILDVKSLQIFDIKKKLSDSEVTFKEHIKDSLQILDVKSS